MRPSDIQLTNTLIANLKLFQLVRPMPGILTQASFDCLVRQIVDSVRRVRYVTIIRNKNHDNSVYDPTSIAFDPIKAAAKYMKNGNIDEAAWLIFLATHFGKNKKTKWQLLKNVYGALGQQAPWTWNRVTNNISAFRNWLSQNEVLVKVNANFGNHRKYETINALKENGTGEAVETYINWITSNGGHSQLFVNTVGNCGNDIRKAFDELYNEMSCVKRFGRTARFDYVCMLGKLGLIQVEPGSTYMIGATGPYSGAELLFGSQQTQATFDLWLKDLESHLGLYYGMQVLEDSLCNWQKSPNTYRYFGG